jgi:hypothetical protein
MFTAGVRPADQVRSTNWANAGKSTTPSARNGSKTAEMPSIGRHGFSEGIGMSV